MREDMFGKCDNCKAKTPLTDLYLFQKKWFFGLFHHAYYVCPVCNKRLVQLRELGMLS